MSGSAQSSSSALNKPPSSKLSWKPRKKERGNTAPAAPPTYHQAQQPPPYGIPFSAEPEPGLRERSATDPILRDGDPQRLVLIDSYRLSWPLLRKYLETNLDCNFSSPGSLPALNEDVFAVWLPRALQQKEKDEIEALRKPDQKQQKRREEAAGCDQAVARRELDSDEEEKKQARRRKRGAAAP